MNMTMTAIPKTDIETSQVSSPERLIRFHNASRARIAAPKETPRRRNFDTAFFADFAALPYWERYSRSLAFALENEPVHVFPDELIVGMLYQAAPDPAGYGRDEKAWEPYNFWKQTGEKIAAAGLDPFLASGGAPGHVGWRWDWILEQGVEGIVAKIQERLDAPHDEKADHFYRSVLILWKSVLQWNEMHVKALRNSLETAPSSDRRRISQLIEICSRVPRLPARSFREAVQSFNMQHLAVMFENPFGGNGPGRLDYFLWPYLERDLADGVITLTEARELVDELFIRFEERLAPWDGWVESVVVGGSHPDGSSSLNPLSYMMVRSIMALNQTHPMVYPRISRSTPDDFIELCADYLVNGQNRAQIYNDDVCIPAIVRSGTPPEDAAMYMAGGCMEISVQGMNCDLNFARTQNVAKILELVLNGGCDLRDGRRLAPLERTLAEFADFEELYSAFENELRREYAAMVKGLDISSGCYAEFRPCALISSLMGDCVERGREQQDGGSRYHEYGFTPLGITTAADSLYAIRLAVFEERRLSAAELLSSLRSDFDGREDLRNRLRALPKYGQGHAGADAFCGRVMKSVCDLSRELKTRFGGQLKPMIFNFVWTPSVSAELGARADGSHAGDLISHGMTPQNFAMTAGVTSALRSCAGLDYSCVPGGATTMWDMDHAWITPDIMKSLLKVFMDRGGMIFQGNTSSVEELLKAQKKPADYPHLIVRVGGYSDHFTSLSPEIQSEIIRRRRHSR